MGVSEMNQSDPNPICTLAREEHQGYFLSMDSLTCSACLLIANPPRISHKKCAEYGKKRVSPAQARHGARLRIGTSITGSGAESPTPLVWRLLVLLYTSENLCGYGEKCKIADVILIIFTAYIFALK